MKKTTKPCIVFDYSKLRGRIIEKYGTVTGFATKIDRQKSWVSMVLNGKRYLDQRDIVTWANALDVKDSEVKSIFFTH